MIESRRYVIFDIAELSTIDFAEVLETSAETIRKSIDDSKTFVKYDGDMPASVAALTTRSQEYTHSEIMSILDGEEWTSPDLDFLV